MARAHHGVACGMQQHATRGALVSGSAPAAVPPVADDARRSRISPARRDGAGIFAWLLRRRHRLRFRSVAGGRIATPASPHVGAVPAPRCERATAGGHALGRCSRSTIRDPERGGLGASIGGFPKLRARRGARHGKPAPASARDIATAGSTQKPRCKQVDRGSPPDAREEAQRDQLATSGKHGDGEDGRGVPGREGRHSPLATTS
jgi:hypothetical protein